LSWVDDAKGRTMIGRADMGVSKPCLLKELHETWDPPRKAGGKKWDDKRKV